MNSAHISVVIPVYKAVDCLDELDKRLKATLERINKSYEIIYVEDSGTDGSWEKIKKLSKEDTRVKGINFSRNFGQHYAITAGLNYSIGDWVVVMDCDLQDSPEDILKLYLKANEGFDVVIGKRLQNNQAFLKRIASKAFYILFRYLSDMDYEENGGNFRIMSRKVVSHFSLMLEQLRFFSGLVHWLGFKQTYVNVKHNSRFKGRTSYSYAKLWKLSMDAIIAYSDKPLRLAVRLGALMSLVSLVFGVYIFLNSFLYASSVPGWTSLIVSVFLIGGITIFILGIIGIYIGRTFDECKKRPLYIINELVGLAELNEQNMKQTL
jgi:dolichol-phosphate mannosyltransferase